MMVMERKAVSYSNMAMTIGILGNTQNVKVEIQEDVPIFKRSKTEFCVELLDSVPC